MNNCEEIVCYSGKEVLPCYEGKLAIFCAMAFFLFHIQKKQLEFIKIPGKNTLKQILQSFDINL